MCVYWCHGRNALDPGGKVGSRLGRKLLEQDGNIPGKNSGTLRAGPDLVGAESSAPELVGNPRVDAFCEYSANRERVRSDRNGKELAEQAIVRFVGGCFGRRVRPGIGQRGGGEQVVIMREGIGFSSWHHGLG